MTMPLADPYNQSSFSTIHYYFGAYLYDQTNVIPTSLRTVIVSDRTVVI
ncbi:MAG: hypothetical protein RQ856_06220 [Candidatus Izemoplasmatales bacterium]|nr:hypothetical protein [Candidatus Izemoplasmatales bacterium]